MESGSPRGLSRLISELSLGRDLTRQLESHMEQSCPPQQCKHLVQSLLSTWDKAISMARSSSESDGGERRGGADDSPRPPTSDSPRSESSDRGLKEQESREMCKKRKTLPVWTRRVNVCSPTAMEGTTLDDGFSWRKYGQKDILGAKFPRGYYRCTLRHSHGCPATKMVQRSDENPAVFDVTYRGHHTCCVQTENLTPEASTAAAEQGPPRQPPEARAHPNPTDEPILPGFRPGLTVKTEDLDGGSPFPSPSSFSFPHTPVSSWPPPASAPLDSPFAGGFSPPFISPETAFESSRSYPGSRMPPSRESDLATVVYGAASAASSAAVELEADLEFMLDSVESDPNFTFGPGFFS